MYKKMREKIGRLLRKKFYEYWEKARKEYPRPILSDYENPNFSSKTQGVKLTSRERECYSEIIEQAYKKAYGNPTT